MKHETKCCIIGRKKTGEDKYNCLISLFDENDAHLKKLAPKEVIELENVNVIEFSKTKFSYFLWGNDLVVNDLVSVSVESKDDKVSVSVEQN